MPRINLIAEGTIYNNLMVLSENYMHGKNRKYLCRCLICNSESFIFGNNLNKNNSTKCKSCAIIQLSLKRPEQFKDMKECSFKTHGLSDHPMFGAYQQMLRRCDYEKHIQYSDYGGRGISVCDRWKESFANFLEDMGEKPLNCTLDRINVNGNYEKSNCKWSTYSEQAKNKRNTKCMTIDGETKSVHDWSINSGIPSKEILRRLTRGWSEKDAIFKPFKKFKGEKE